MVLIVLILALGLTGGVEHRAPAVKALLAPQPVAEPPPQITIAEAYKRLKPKRKVTLDDVTIRPKSLKAKRVWVIDRCGYTYFTREALKGWKYLTMDVDVSSKSMNPNIPALVLYRVLDGGKLQSVGYMPYEFRRWDDYGTYLGNYRDTGNDFAHRNTLKFSVGMQLDNDRLKNQTMVVLAPLKPCVVRKYNRWSKPPTSYSPSSCDYPNEMHVDDVSKYGVVVARRKGKDARRKRKR